MRLIIVVLLIFSPSLTMAQKVKVSGITYGGLKYPNSLSPSDNGNGGFDLTTKTTFDLGWKLGKAQLLPYFVVYSQADSLGYHYNAKEKLTAGIAVRYNIRRYSQLSFGIKYDYDYRPISGIYYAGLGGTADYSFYRSWHKADTKRVTLAGWANMRYPGSPAPEDKSNLIAQGRFTLAKQAQLRDSKYTGAGFVALGLFSDTIKKDFNNKAQVDFGLSVKRKIRAMDFTLSAKYRIDHRFVSGTTYSGPIIGLSWLQLRLPKEPTKTDRGNGSGWLSKLVGKPR
jgi:hypothetical protein